jgi:hypothetical protein
MENENEDGQQGDGGVDDPKPGTGQGDDAGDPKGADQLGDPGKRALDAMKAERNRARTELKAAQTRLEELENAGKSELQRATDQVGSYKSRAEKSESSLAAFQIAMDRAPAHATLAQVKAVAKRVRGEDADALEADADELFELLAPAPKEKPSGKGGKDDGDDDEDDDRPRRRLPGKPRPKLRGGADPEDEAEESDPRKLADLIRNR